MELSDPACSSVTARCEPEGTPAIHVPDSLQFFLAFMDDMSLPLFLFDRL